MTETSILVTVGLLALLLGTGLGYLLAARRGRQADERAVTAEKELNAYREDVTGHFRETAVHFRALGEQYRSLHEHLAQGAESLCETPRDDERLSFSPLAEIEGPAASATSKTAALDPDGAVLESAPEAEEAPPGVAAAAAATSVVAPPVDYELPGAAEPAIGQPPQDSADDTADETIAAADDEESTDEKRADAASADDATGKAEGDEPDIAVTPGKPDPASAKDEAPTRTIH